MVGNIKITAIKRISKINILDYKYVEPKTTPVKPQNTIEICTSSRGSLSITMLIKFIFYFIFI